jgi:quercetin dioxygenase-like cupin family protein
MGSKNIIGGILKNEKAYFVKPENLKPYSPPGHDNTVNKRLIGEENVGAKNYEVVLGEMSVGGGAHPHSHADMEHGYYMLEGKCFIRVGEETQEIIPGMAVFVPKGIEHEIKVIEPIKFLVFYSPPQFKLDK